MGTRTRNVAAVVAAVGIVAATGAGVAAPAEPEPGELPEEAMELAGASAGDVVVGGAVDGDTDVDLYRVCAGDDGLAVTTALPALGNRTPRTDTVLWVLDAAGRPVAARDDDSNLESRSTVDLGPEAAPRGAYLVAVSGPVRQAADAAGGPLFRFGNATSTSRTLPASVADPSAVLGAWVPRPFVRPSSGDYVLTVQRSVDCGGVVEVDVEVRPGSDAPMVQTRARGVLPVAVLGSAEVPAESLDPATVAVGPGAAPLVDGTALEDVDGDGLADLVGRVRTQDTGLVPGDAELCATASTTDGVDVAGCDEIRTR